MCPAVLLTRSNMAQPEKKGPASLERAVASSQAAYAFTCNLGLGLAANDFSAGADWLGLL